jgi:hypothetical protein
VTLRGSDQPPEQAGPGPAEQNADPRAEEPAAGAEPETELEEAKAELDTLRARLDTKERRGRRVRTARKVAAAVLVMVAALGTTVSIIGVWAARTTLDTDRWVQTVSPLAQDPQVQAAMTTYVTEQLYAQLDVPARVKDVLPPNAAFLAVPISGRVHDYLGRIVEQVLTSEQFSRLWPEMNRLAHEEVLQIINGGDSSSGLLVRKGNEVRLDLLPVINDVLRLLERQVPTLFGKTVDLPELGNGAAIPPDLRVRIETALGVQLPDNFGAVTIYKANKLGAVQDALELFKRGLVAFALGSLACLVLALWVSPTRRRTVLQYGVWLAVFVIVLRGLRVVVRDSVLSDIPAGVYRDGAASAVQIVLAPLRDRGTLLLWSGIVIAAVAYLVGPGRGPVWLRRRTVAGAHGSVRGSRRATAVAVARGPAFARQYLDPLRIGGLVVAGLLALLLASWVALLVLAVLLVAYELLVTAAAGSAPPPGPPPTGLVPQSREGRLSADVDLERKVEVP